MSEALPNYAVPEDRALSAEEQLLLSWMLEHGTPEAKAYKSQLPDLKIYSRCQCGCPTVFFTVKDRAPQLGRGMTTLSEFGWRAPNGDSLGVWVHATDGQIYGLELVMYGGAKELNEYSWPPTRELRPLESAAP